MSGAVEDVKGVELIMTCLYGKDYVSENVENITVGMS